MIEILGSSRIRDARRRGGTLQSRRLCKWRPWRQVQPSNLSRQELTVSALAQRVSGCSLMFCMLRSLYMALCCITLCQALCTILRILTGPVPSHALHRKTDLKTSQTSLHASSRAWTWMKHIEALYHVMICWHILWWVMHGMTSMAGSKIKKTAEACEILWN